MNKLIVLSALLLMAGVAIGPGLVSASDNDLRDLRDLRLNDLRLRGLNGVNGLTPFDGVDRELRIKDDEIRLKVDANNDLNDLNDLRLRGIVAAPTASLAVASPLTTASLAGDSEIRIKDDEVRIKVDENDLLGANALGVSPLLGTGFLGGVNDLRVRDFGGLNVFDNSGPGSAGDMRDLRDFRGLQGFGPGMILR